MLRNSFRERRVTRCILGWLLVTSVRFWFSGCLVRFFVPMGARIDCVPSLMLVSL